MNSHMEQAHGVPLKTSYSEARAVKNKYRSRKDRKTSSASKRNQAISSFKNEGAGLLKAHDSDSVSKAMLGNKINIVVRIRPLIPTENSKG